MSDVLDPEMTAEIIAVAKRRATEALRSRLSAYVASMNEQIRAIETVDDPALDEYVRAEYEFYSMAHAGRDDISGQQAVAEDVAWTARTQAENKMFGVIDDRAFCHLGIEIDGYVAHLVEGGESEGGLDPKDDKTGLADNVLPVVNLSPDYSKMPQERTAHCISGCSYNNDGMLRHHPMCGLIWPVVPFDYMQDEDPRLLDHRAATQAVEADDLSFEDSLAYTKDLYREMWGEAPHRDWKGR